MEILPYTDDHRNFRESIRKFLKRELVDQAPTWEVEGLVPREAWRKMGSKGSSA